ncbi:hypothetical protein MA16_Dca006351 [Dendrobium catenatum]|uniref:Uncharacterized protein n=1 Tax=Dendrobium catenatum TaxID=906689 RepID=A0A2I0W9M8_9ASPA|nr:hypothetical protein MA16_Dca006351 [Dendrobium catenatum]
MNLSFYFMRMMLLSLVRILLTMLTISRLFLIILLKLQHFVLTHIKVPSFLLISVTSKRKSATFWGLITQHSILSILVCLFL